MWIIGLHVPHSRRAGDPACATGWPSADWSRPHKLMSSRGGRYQPHAPAHPPDPSHHTTSPHLPLHAECRDGANVAESLGGRLVGLRKCLVLLQVTGGVAVQNQAGRSAAAPSSLECFRGIGGSKKPASLWHCMACPPHPCCAAAHSQLRPTLEELCVTSCTWMKTEIIMRGMHARTTRVNCSRGRPAGKQRQQSAAAAVVWQPAARPHALAQHCWEHLWHAQYSQTGGKLACWTSLIQ